MGGLSLDNPAISIEILYGICAHLCWHCQGRFGRRQVGDIDNPECLDRYYQPLAALCRTSKRLHAAAVEHLYHAIFLNTGSTIIPPLLQTLIKTPSLRRMPRTLIFDLDYDEECVTELSDDVLALFEEAASRQTVTLPWHDGVPLEDGQMASILMQLLLLHLPRLERLSLAFHRRSWPLDVLSSWNPSIGDETRPPPLNALKVLSLEHGFYEGGFPGAELNEFSPLMHIAPNLLTVCADVCVGLSCGLELANVTDLQLSNSRLASEELQFLVTSCNELRFFMYFSLENRDYPDSARPSEVVRLLHANHRSSLQTLALDRIPLYSRGNDWTKDDIISELSDFARLRNLYLNVASFTLPRREEEDSAGPGIALLRNLPETVERACFVGDLDLIYPDLLGLVDKASLGAFPNLKEVRVFHKPPNSMSGIPIESSKTRAIRKAFIDVGVASPERFLFPNLHW